MDNQQLVVPFGMYQFNTPEQTYDIDAVLEHRTGELTIVLQFTLDDEWSVATYTNCIWTDIRRVVKWALEHSDNPVICYVFIGHVLEWR